MARERMVTRTVETAHYTILCVNLTEQKLEQKNADLSNTIDEKDVVKMLDKSKFFGNEYKPVSIVEKNVETTLYGMPEVDFIKLAKVLPLRSANTEEVTEETTVSEKPKKTSKKTVKN